MSKDTSDLLQPLIKKNLQRLLDVCVTEIKKEDTIDQINKELLFPILRAIYKEIAPYLITVLVVILILLTLCVGIILLLLYVLKRLSQLSSV
jgi:hypothetical protein